MAVHKTWKQERIRIMRQITANMAQNELASVLDNVITQGDKVSIAKDRGVVVLVSEDEWNGMIETLYLQSIPGMAESILKGKATPIKKCLDNIGWDIN